MIIVSDTTPIIALMKAEHLEWLRLLYDEINIPEAVYRELTTNDSFQDESEKIKKCGFIRVSNVKNLEAVNTLRNDMGLDAGESEAIVLYSESKADLLLLDEHKARGIAKQMEIEFVGTLGIIMMAYEKGIASAIEVEESIDHMLQSGIRYSARLCNKVLEHVGRSSKY